MLLHFLIHQKNPSELVSFDGGEGGDGKGGEEEEGGGQRTCL